MSRTVYLHNIGTALPENRLKQSEILNFMANMPGIDNEKKGFLEKIYNHSAIENRHSVIGDYGKDINDYEFFPKSKDLSPFPSTQDRNKLFTKHAKTLSHKAAEKALFGLAMKPEEISHIITVSCTGFSAPGFDLELIASLNLSKNIFRHHLGFMGCFAMFPALRLAQTICREDKKAKVLIVSVELCTLHFQKHWELDSVVANALFADGAAACVVTSQKSDSTSPLYTLDNFDTEIIPQSEDRMAWTIGDTGFLMKLSSFVPKLIESNLGKFIQKIRARAGNPVIDEWAIHPGGRAILDKAKTSLNLGETALNSSYKVLREHGNMSSATILFVFNEMSKHETKKKRKVFASSFGPGLTVESALLTRLPLKNLPPPLFPKLTNRSSQSELMDLPHTNKTRLLKTIRQFENINGLFSNYKKLLTNEILNQKNEVLEIADIGSGGGDIPRFLVREARKRNISIKIHAYEPDKNLTAWLREACKDYPEIEVIEKNFYGLPDEKSYDHIISHHVLHHLNDDLAVDLFKKSLKAARVGMLHMDLRRSIWPYIGYFIATLFLFRGGFARYDGLLSIRRSFTKVEVEELIAKNSLNLFVRSAKPGRIFIKSNDIVTDN